MSQFFNTPHVKVVQLDCNFIVDHANGDGLGLRSLKGQGIDQVLMYTTATPAGNNPAAGYVFVRFSKPYPRLFSGYYSLVSPTTGSNINISSSSVLTIGDPYVITALGTSTTANWQAVGFPATSAPNVGMSFIASVTGSGTGTGTVKAVTPSTIVQIETIGDSSQTIGANSATVNSVAGGTYRSGGYLIFQILSPTSSSVTTLVPTNPVDGTVVSLVFYLSDSSVTVAGE